MHAIGSSTAQNTNDFNNQCTDDNVLLQFGERGLQIILCACLAGLKSANLLALQVCAATGLLDACQNTRCKVTTELEQAITLKKQAAAAAVKYNCTHSLYKLKYTFDRSSDTMRHELTNCCR